MKYDWVLHITSSPPVLILPMRDWNQRSVAHRSPFFQRFDLTYEGLKSFKIYILKTLTFVLILPMRDWNGEFLPLRHQILFVLILPMRDWNQKKFISKKQKVKRFWSYLWGIEINLSSLRLLACLAFWSYLWGIEIYTCKVSCVGLIFVLILPMRDWNKSL